MVKIFVTQYINDAWVNLAAIHMTSMLHAINYIDNLQRTLASDSPGTITLRGDVDSLLVVNLNHGPVRLSIQK